MVFNKKAIQIGREMADGDIDLYADVDEDFASEEFHEEESLIKDEIVDKIEDDYKGIDYMIFKLNSNSNKSSIDTHVHVCIIRHIF